MTKRQPAPGDAASLRADVPRTRAELRAIGVSDGCLSREHTPLLRGQWLHGDVRPEVRHFLLAALQRSPDDAFLTRQSAAAIHGGIVPSEGVIHVGTTSDRRVRTPGMILHRYSQRPAVVLIDGLPVTSKAQTFLDLAPILGLVDLVILGDSLSLGDKVFPAELRRHTAEARGRGVVAARSAAALVRVGAESARRPRARDPPARPGPPGRDARLRPAAFLDRVAAACRERGIVVPKRLDPRWQLHFRS